MAVFAANVICNHVVGIPATAYILTTCPRCRGKGIYHAFNILQSGHIEFLTGVAALKQTISKILIETRRPSGYGFDYSILAGNPTGNFTDTIRAEITRVMQYLVDLQQQERAAGFRYLPTEEIAVIDEIDVERDTTDPRKYIVTVFLTTVSGVQFQVSENLLR